MDFKGVICYTCYLLTVFSAAVGMYQSKDLYFFASVASTECSESFFLFLFSPHSRGKFLSRKLKCVCSTHWLFCTGFITDVEYLRFLHISFQSSIPCT